MRHDEFNEFIEDIFRQCKKLLVTKAEEYAKGDDRLEQFKRQACAMKTNPVRECLSLQGKHYTSLVDMAQNPLAYTKKAWMEKLLDFINYGLLTAANYEDMRQAAKGD